MEIKNKTKEYYQQLYVHQFDNRRNTPIPWKTQLPTLRQGEIDNLKRPISTKEIESMINNLPKEKAQVQMVSLMNSTKHLKNKLYQFYTKCFRGEKHREALLTCPMKPALP